MPGLRSVGDFESEIKVEGRLSACAGVSEVERSAPQSVAIASGFITFRIITGRIMPCRLSYLELSHDTGRDWSR